jgi:UDP-glucose 4-epimerase
MKILITGALGFIGYFLSASLEASGHEVVRVGRSARPTTEFATGFNDVDLLHGPAAGCEVVVHLACTTQPATSDAAIERDISDNVAASARFFARCGDAGVGRIVLASSGGTVYGDLRNGDRAWRETDSCRPTTAHGAMKLAVESYLRVVATRTAVRPVVARIGNAYGRRGGFRPDHGVVEAMVRAVIADRELTIWGDAMRDYVHIDDVVRALVAMIEAPMPEPVYNVGTGRATSLIALLAHVEEALGKRARVRREPARSGDLRRNVLDAALLRSDLAWEPRVSLEAGIARLVSQLDTAPFEARRSRG